MKEKKNKDSQVFKQVLVRCFLCRVGGFLMYFCGFLTIPISDVLSEKVEFYCDVSQQCDFRCSNRGK